MIWNTHHCWMAWAAIMRTKQKLLMEKWMHIIINIMLKIKWKTIIFFTFCGSEVLFFFFFLFAFVQCRIIFVCFHGMSKYERLWAVVIMYFFAFYWLIQILLAIFTLFKVNWLNEQIFIISSPFSLLSFNVPVVLHGERQHTTKISVLF